MTNEPAISIDESDLIRRLLLHHEHAWKDFLLRYERLVFSQVLRTANRFQIQISESEAEDICASVYSGLLQNNMRSLRSFDGRSKIGTWLTVVTRRTCIKELGKRQKAIAKESLNESLQSNLPNALTQLIQNEDKEKLRSTMDQLEDSDKQILELYYDQNMGYKEISLKLGISVNTVGPKLTRAHHRLRQRMRWS